MTICCQCDGVTPPPPPPTGACCYFDPAISTTVKQCENNVHANDCTSRLGGIHFPSQTCAQVEPCQETCFTPESLVLMSDKTEKKISEVSVGDFVLSIDGVGQNKVIHVETTLLGNRKLVSINGSQYFFSHDHPILTSEGFKSLDSSLSSRLYPDLEFAGDLEIGDTIYLKTGEEKVKSIEVKEDSYLTTLYDLSLDDEHIYFVNGIAFHNCSTFYPCCRSTGQCVATFNTAEYPSCPEALSFVTNCNQCTTTTTTTTTGTTTTEAPTGACCTYKINNQGAAYFNCISGRTRIQCTTQDGDQPGKNRYFPGKTCDPNPCPTTTTTTQAPELFGCCTDPGLPNQDFNCQDVVAPEVCEAIGGTVIIGTCDDYPVNPCRIGTCCKRSCCNGTDCADLPNDGQPFTEPGFCGAGLHYDCTLNVFEGNCRPKRCPDGSERKQGGKGYKYVSRCDRKSDGKPVEGPCTVQYLWVENQLGEDDTCDNKSSARPCIRDYLVFF